MTQPAVSPAAQQMYDSLPDTWRERDDGSWLLLGLCAGLSAGAEERWALLEDPGPRGFLDPATVPAKWLPLMAARNGARLTPGMTVEQQRAEVANPTGWRRGLPDSILEAATVFLPDDAWFLLRQRTNPDVAGDQPAHLALSLRWDDFTVDERAAVLAEFNRRIPIGMFGHLLMLHITWGEEAAEHTSWGDLSDAHATWGDVSGGAH